MEFGNLALYGGACALSFAFFVFFAGRLNPFVKPKRFDPAYRRVSYFRFVAGALLICTLLALFTHTQLSLSRLIAGSLGSILFILLIAFPTLRYHRLKMRKKSAAEQQDDHLTLSSIQAKPSNIRRSPVSSNLGATTDNSPSAWPNSTLPDSTLLDTPFSDSSLSSDEEQPDTEQPGSNAMVQTTPAPEANTDNDEVLPNLTRTEYELEMALRKSTNHIDDNLTDLDQSIVEAEFEAVLLAESKSNDVAKPDFSHADAAALNHIEKELDSHDLNLAEQSARSNGDEQAQKIAALQHENTALAQKHELLKGTVAQLELSVRQREAAVRKNIALKEQAVEVKNKALTMAAMERKKRKLTEIKAQKIILKLKNNMRQLEHDSVERQV